ncbi:RhuM family protein [Roseburia yibonii]|uniref:RhuM family protein n=1 Tax=Roseburia yibonii TaxID=2763063 RepID=UPI001FACCCB9|nr:RhuM family protein [Roseburia yibonii]
MDENATTELFSIVQNERQRNVKRKVKCYNLDAIIAVGYRVNSKKDTRFRQWVTKTLKEVSRLNRLVTMFIDYAELMAEDEILMSMQDWVDQTNQFLENNRRKVLAGKGKVSHDAAMQKAEKEYEVFRVKQDREYVSEFDREVEKYLKG